MSGIFEATEPTPKNIARVREAFELLPDADLAAAASAQPATAKGYVANQLLAERRAAREESAASTAKHRHEELLRRIEQPHWTATPGFLIGVTGVLAGVVAAVFAYLSYAQQLQPAAQVQPSAQTSVSGVQTPASSSPPRTSSSASQSPGPRK